MNTCKKSIENKKNMHLINGSLIQQLIDKYEEKVKSAVNLKYKGTSQFSDAPTKSDRDRLDVRIYERKSFIVDLKLLLNGD